VGVNKFIQCSHSGILQLQPLTYLEKCLTGFDILIMETIYSLIMMGRRNDKQSGEIPMYKEMHGRIIEISEKAMQALWEGIHHKETEQNLLFRHLPSSALLRNTHSDQLRAVAPVSAAPEGIW
jgi:hypothetical protein